ncbi:MAG: SDR family NAD(P)-dependent oxidoreductase [Candidatus Howiella sp.]|jgi:short-subunit dehydrogenase
MKALITGASSGIGRDMARVLAGEGWELILIARRLDRLEALAAELPGASVRVIAADLSKQEECLRLYHETAGEGIDLLINNAGFGHFGRFDETGLERDLELISTNITAVHILTKLFLRDFVKRDSGRILNVASSAGFMAGPMLSGYYASKNYVVRLTEAIYEELRRKKSRVTVSLLCPGPVNTEFNRVAGVRFALRGLSSEYVARCAVRGTLRGKLVIQPGIMMKLARFGGRFLPEKAMLRISYHIQKSKERPGS